MRKIQVEELKPGMRFDKPVYIDSNNIFIGANITIKEEDIKKLMKWGVSDIETAGKLIATKEEIRQKRFLLFVTIFFLKYQRI